MLKFGMKSLEDTPTEDIVKHDVWMLENDERKQLLRQLTGSVIASFTDLKYHHDGNASTDAVFEHSRQLLSIGLFYMYFRDAIKEGDGNRVVRCWRYMLPMFYFTSRKNYANEALIFLANLAFLPGRISNQMIWSRFVNTKGVLGGNIPADLFNEHLNRLCKEAVRSLRSNKTKEGIIRVGKALGTISPILRKFDDDNCVPLPSGKHASISAERDRSIIINELIKYEVLKNQDGRSIRGLVKPKSLMKKGLQKDLLEWIGTKTEQYYDS